MEEHIDRQVYLIDVGATQGINGRWERIKDYLKPFLFDPDPRAEFPDIGIPQTVIRCALNQKPGPVTLYLCKKPDVSSLYFPNIDFLEKYIEPDFFTIISEEKVEAENLDSQKIKKQVPRIDFAKLDTQGSELDILKGGLKSMENTIGIETEVEFTHLYKEQPLFSDVDIFLRQKGFELFDLRKSCWKLRMRIDADQMAARDKGRLVAGDALYFKDPDTILKSKDGGYCFRACLCFIAYGYKKHALYIAQNAKKSNLFDEQDLKDIELLIEHLSQNKAVGILERALSKMLKVLGMKHYSKAISKFKRGQSSLGA